MTYDSDNFVAMRIPASLFHDRRTRGHRLRPHHPQLKPFHLKGISKLGTQLLLNLPRYHPSIFYLLGKRFPPFISSGQWELPPAFHVQHAVLQVQGFPNSLPVKHLQLCQLILRELQLSYPTVIPPFYSLVESACQQNLQRVANGWERSGCNSLHGQH